MPASTAFPHDRDVNDDSHDSSEEEEEEKDEEDALPISVAGPFSVASARVFSSADKVGSA